ncbi:MAG: hypothetical protein II392_01755 [Mycoplasma sp.]|nr:hypothetical protein [Mycoplasma sp.]MBQ6279954.1 hypothetical protein [Mycoplasma sp.]
MEKLKSKIKRNSEIDYNQEFEITQLHADKAFIEYQKSKFKEIMPNASETEIEKQITNLVARNNSVDLIIDGIYKYFDITIDDGDVKAFADRIKNNVLNDKQGNISNDTMKKMVADDKTLQNIAVSTLKRNLLFNELATLWDIRITDEDVKKSLDNYYQKTNMPIRDILNDKNKFESVRQIMLNERISIELLRRFKVNFNFPKKPDDKKNSN